MKLKTLKDKGELNMILSRRELVVTFFAVEIDRRISYQISLSEWDYADKDLSKDKDLETVIDTFCSTTRTKTIILTGFYDEGNVDFFPRTLTTKYRVYNYLNSEDKLVLVK